MAAQWNVWNKETKQFEVQESSEHDKNKPIIESEQDKK